ncbi:hypothetical protein ACOMHN_026182 [Nucella lapillus]
MVISFLYMIRRPSCEVKGCSHLSKVSEADHRNTVEGLLQLGINGVTVNTFGQEEWNSLARCIISVFPSASGCTGMRKKRLLYRNQPRLGEDDLMKKDLETVKLRLRIEGS